MAFRPDEEHLENGGVRWVLAGTERQQIAKLLDVEESTIDHVNGNVMNRARETCSGCGKRSGLDDLVHSALELGVHAKEFMLGVFRDGPKSTSPPHALYCSGCATQFDGVFAWHNNEDEGNWWA